MLLALIGPHWLGATNEKGERRLAADRDYVRIEIAAALKRDIPVIPVLIDGARLPSEEELPEELAALSRRHALELRHTRFAADADAIVGSLKDHLAKPRKTWLWPIAAALLVGTVCLAASLYFLTGRTPTETEFASPSTPAATQPSGVTAPSSTPNDSTVEQSDTAPSNAEVQDIRSKLEQARRKMEEAKRKVDAAKGGASPAEAQADSDTPQQAAVAPATDQTSGRLSTLSVMPGAAYDRVKAAYPSAAESGGDLNLPLDGVLFEFTKDTAPVLRVILIRAPFTGNVNGIELGDTGDAVVAKMGRQPNYVAQVYSGSGYAYQMDGYTLRFDVDKSNKVVEIWQILDRG